VAAVRSAELFGDADCGAAGGDVITEWQFPIGAFGGLVPCSAPAGAAVLCPTEIAGSCAPGAVSAWLVTSCPVTNK